MLRFSQSPTGDMHIGSLRVAILNYLMAQQEKKPFLIRIDDLKKEENIEGKDTEIMQILEKFALIHHSVFHQSEHLHMHQTLAIKLLEENKAFVCTCSTKTLTLEQEEAKSKNLPYQYSGCCENKDKTEHTKLKESKTPFVLRLKKPIQPIVYHDLILGDISIAPHEIDSFIILHEDGTPSEAFASACDDMLCGISCLISEENTLLDTTKQHYIKNQLSYTQKTSYAHLPTILDMDDAYSVKELFKQGFIPDAIINYLILLGTSKTPKEIFTLPEAIAWFTLDSISNSPVHFNSEKLRFINREHLRKMDDKELSSLFGFADTDVGKLVKLYLEEASTINELASKIRPIFAPKSFEGIYTKQMRKIQEIIANAPMISNYDTFKNHIITESGLKDKDLDIPLRLLLTGVEEGPELSHIYPLIKSYLLEVAS